MAPSRPGVSDGDLTLIVGSRSISGWTSVSVTRGIELMPSHFDISMTERYPGEADFVVMPGDPCRVLLGKDVVITGYIDGYIPSLDAHGHTVRIFGRGKCQDIVDCCAFWPSCQFMNSSVLTIAQKLCEPYGVKVSGETGLMIPQYNFTLSEKVYPILEEMCRYSGLLLYEMTDGNMLLSRVGNARCSGGLVEGVNIEKASFEQRIDGRYSEYSVERVDFDPYKEFSDAGNLIATVNDGDVHRKRVLHLIAENGNYGLDIAKLRAAWEMKRRFGRGFKLDITTDSWRDSKEALWEPNTLIPVSLPALKVPDKLNWLISEVTYLRDETGTHARLTLMPPEAFSVEPILPVWVRGMGDVIPANQP